MGIGARRKCVSLVLALLDARYDENMVGMSQRSDEYARITLVLWTEVVLSTTFDADGTKNYIPTFTRQTIYRSKANKIEEICLALQKRNKNLACDFSPGLPVFDIISIMLAKIPSEIEAVGGFHLSTLMKCFLAEEERQRSEEPVREELEVYFGESEMEDLELVCSVDVNARWAIEL